VQRSQRHLLAMINDLLNLSEVDAGRVQYDIVHVPVGAALQSVATLLTPHARANGMSITVAPLVDGDEALAVQADAEKLEQILVNLISNAIKFSAPSGRIVLDASRCVDDASLVEIRVHDTGVGISPTQLASIFEPFVQLGTPVHGPREGIGLGLSISRMLARGMGGDLTAESEVGAGSTMMLRVPLS
jgi:signal transduction histidine kinase